jgi:hypothetical protein
MAEAMSNPYDLSTGDKGFPALARSEVAELYRLIRQLRDMNAQLERIVTSEREGCAKEGERTVEELRMRRMWPQLAGAQMVVDAIRNRKEPA